MKKINLKQAAIQTTIDGEPEVADLTKELGNMIFGKATTIPFSDFGKAIYYSKGEIDIPVDVEGELREFVTQAKFFAPIQRYILGALDKEDEGGEEI